MASKKPAKKVAKPVVKSAAKAADKKETEPVTAGATPPTKPPRPQENLFANPDSVQPVQLQDEMERSFLDYAM